MAGRRRANGNGNGNGTWYPQLNMNSALSLGVVAMLVGGAVWFGQMSGKMDALGSDLSGVKQELREVKSVVTDAGRSQAALVLQTEGRVSKMEIIMQGLVNRVDQNERDRKVK